MKFRVRILFAALLSCMLGVALAAAQPLPCQNCQSPGCVGHGHGTNDCCTGLGQQIPPNPLAPGRPSPVPCCADGVCYPNPTTWGHYGTRWRRWPIEYKEAPDGAAPGGVSPDLEPYSPPSINEEDRRAPPSSAPRGDELDAAPRRPPAEGEAPDRPEGAAPAGPATRQPGLSSPTGGPSPSLDAPFGIPTPQTPGTMPLEPPLPDDPIFDDSMGDTDRPPAPPFAAPRLSTQPIVRPGGQPAPAAPVRANNGVPEDDPPPALPSGLASLS